LSAALSLPSLARAQSVENAAAQALFDDAKRLMADGHAAEACPKLEESQRLEPRSGTLINLASCYEQTGHLASAWARYVDAAASANLGGNAEREAVARERAAALAPRLTKLLIAIAPKTPQGLEVRRDGVVVGQPAWGVALPSDPGPHRISASAPGHQPFEVLVDVQGEGKTITVHVPELVANAPTEPVAAPHPGLNTRQIAALVAGGIGVVGIGVGTVFGFISKSKHDEAERSCQGDECTTQQGLDASMDAHKAGNVSTVAMIVGGVGLAAGVTLWLTAPKPNSGAPSAQVGLGFGTVRVQGAF